MRALGVDVGGTFTDFLLWDDGRLRVHKSPSTTADPAAGVLRGLRESGLSADEVVHGSTVATNAVLTRSGARTALVTTRGFRDLLAIGRQARDAADLYSLAPRKVEPLVPANLCLEVDERVDWRGSILRPLAAAEVERTLRRLRRARVEAVALCLLFSFLAPAHERTLAAAIRKLGLFVCASHEVLPEAREYERASTTVINAYVGPLTARYLGRLEEKLAALGGQRLRVMLSDGTAAEAGVAAETAVRTILSGPAAGVTGAFAVAREAGYTDILTLDMGGTSADVSVCPGRIVEQMEARVGDFPVATPCVDVHSVGAGGGSIASIDEAGALRVGPESAGADPGPACYGGGGPATVTDAHVALGRILPEHFLDGRLPLYPERAGEALAGIAGAFSGDVAAAAAAVVAVANANMERALRRVTLERGYDPRTSTLVAFGGAGPLHACELAAALGVRRVLVPPYPGLLSALGLLVADTAGDRAVPIYALVEPGAVAVQRRLERAAAEAEGQLRAALEAAGLPTGGARRELLASMRYPGQSHELLLPVPSLEPGELCQRFHQAHQERFGHADPTSPVELVSLRVRVAAPSGRSVSAAGEAPAPGRRSPWRRRRVWFGRWVSAAFVPRASLEAGMEVAGPAVVTQMDATTAVPPGWRALVDRHRNLILERE